MMAKKYEWMEPASVYNKLIPELSKEDARFLQFEKKSTEGIVKQIVKAVEATKPKLRYGAPWYQFRGVQLLRILGR